MRKQLPMQIPDAAKASELHQTPIQVIQPGRRREFHPSFVSVLNWAGGAKRSGGGIGAPEFIHVPPNLGGQYQSRWKTCQEEIVKKSQNVRGKSQHLSICSGRVPQCAKHVIFQTVVVRTSNFYAVHLAFPNKHLML